MQLSARTFKKYLELRATIETEKKFLKAKKIKLDKLIKLSSPKDVKSVSYEENIHSVVKMSDMEYMLEINKLSIEIREDEKLIKRYEDTLRDIEREIGRYAKTMPDLTYRVFNLYFVERKKQFVIAKELYMSERQVRHYVKKIKSILKGVKYD